MCWKLETACSRRGNRKSLLSATPGSLQVHEQALWRVGEEARRHRSCKDLMSFCMYRVFTAGDDILRSVLGCVPPPALYKTQELPGLSPLLGGFLSATVIISVMSQIPFCGPSGVDHFFCDFTPLLELSHTGTVTLMFFAAMTCFLDPILPFLFTWSSCVHQSCHPEERLPSGAGRQKDFSTGSSCLTSATLFYDTLILGCVMPRRTFLREVDKAPYLHHPHIPVQSSHLQPVD